MPRAPHRLRAEALDARAAELAIEAARARGATLDDPLALELVALVGAAAPAVLDALLHDATLPAALAGELREHGAVAPAALPPPPTRERLAEGAPHEPEALDRAKAALRALRHEALARTALRELHASADVDATAREWSRVAAGCIAHALAYAEAHWEARGGTPLDEHRARVPFCVLGMGKLGGDELNLGSDVDVCFFYGTDEGSAGPRTLHEHFARVASTLTELLADATGDGFAFRVDLRLRPEGSRGPLANSLAGAERYYETWGRSWERAALLRAQPVAGDLAFGDTLQRALRPFVFRRSVEPQIARDVADMLRRARRELLRDDARDLKLGAGGIREAEFAVQALQLVWGGRHPSLQVANTLTAAARLRALGLLSHREARALTDAWALLRRVEHRVQTMASYQTHLLPDDPQARSVLARSLGYRSAEALDAALARARGAVRALFRTIEPPPAGSADAPALDEPRVGPEAELADLVAAGADRATVSQRARAVLGVRDGDTAADDLQRLGRRVDLPLGAVARERTPALGPALLAEVRDAPDPDRALSYLADLFSRLRGAARYGERLAASPPLARGLVGLFGASDTLSATLLARPELLDAVVAGGTGAPSLEQVRTRAALNEPLDVGDDEVVDAAVGALRRAAREVTLEVGLADMAGELAPREVTARLTALAEGVVRACFELAARETVERFGRVAASDDPLAGVCVVALGSLAAGELGYGGDVDLLVLHALEGESRGGRRRAITAPEFAARLAQRALTFLSAPHGEGEGYAADTRLRPSGAQGTLVSSLEGFARYHRAAGAAASATAAPWERQALLRARVCAGDAALAAQVEALLARVAYEPGPTDAREVRRLRARMESELGGERRGALGLKYGAGGLVDVEFAAQVLQLSCGATERSVRTPETRAALEALRACGALDEGLAGPLLEGEAFLRRALLAARLITGRSTLVPGHPATATVARKLGYRERGEQRAEELFLADLAAQRSAVRAAFDAVLARAGAPG